MKVKQWDLKTKLEIVYMNSDLPKRTYEDFAKFLGTKPIKLGSHPIYHDIFIKGITKDAIKFMKNLIKYEKKINDYGSKIYRKNPPRLGL
jgi:hypothetical protein